MITLEPVSGRPSVKHMDYYLKNTTDEQLIRDIFEVDIDEEPLHFQEYVQKFINANTTELFDMLDTEKQNRLIRAIGRKIWLKKFPPKEAVK